MMDRRQFEPEELEAIARCKGTGALQKLARELKRSWHSVYCKKHEMVAAAVARQACGAFLPDNGLPYRVVMQNIFRGTIFETRDQRWQAAIADYPTARTP